MDAGEVQLRAEEEEAVLEEDVDQLHRAILLPDLLRHLRQGRRKERFDTILGIYQLLVGFTGPGYDFTGWFKAVVQVWKCCHLVRKLRQPPRGYNKANDSFPQIGYQQQKVRIGL